MPKEGVLIEMNDRDLSVQEKVLGLKEPPKDIQKLMKSIEELQPRINPSPMKTLHLMSSLGSSYRVGLTIPHIQSSPEGPWESIGKRVTQDRKENLEQDTGNAHGDPEGGLGQEMSTQREALKNDKITGLLPTSDGKQWRELDYEGK
jgi:hypothetical protein